MGGITVTAPQSRFGGLIGANVNAASNLYAAGMNDRLSQITGPGASVAATGGGGSNREIGRQMMMASGWGGDQWAALDALWTGESNWNEKARNASSGATGIPQALPGSKMASAGADWLTNPATQIKWGLGYIRERYGSPSAAYAAWQQRSPHWYGRGGSGIYRKGALIGVGDSQPSGGSEHVTVRRLRPGQPANENATGGGINVVVQMHNVTIGSATEAKRIAKGLGEQIAREITSALREAPMAAVA
jgi:hypothetical protein